MKKTILSGIRPTGDLHIGHLLGAIDNWNKLQDKYSCYFMVADLHAITTPFDKSQIKNTILETVGIYLACGIDPKKSILFRQSDIQYHTQLMWYLNCITPFGELGRMTQFKEKSAKNPESINAGLWDYPVLMASDILLYNADIVPVGEDQVQHVEFARQLARRFNKKYGQVFKEPKAELTKFKRVMSLSDPNKKMSKTDSPNSYIALLDSPEDIRKKIGSAVTDTGPSEKMSKAVKNLFDLLESFATDDIYQRFLKDYENKTLKYSELKPALADAMVLKLKPIQEKYNDLVKNPDEIWNVIESGNTEASKVAEKTYNNAKKAMGL